LKLATDGDETKLFG